MSTRHARAVTGWWSDASVPELARALAAAPEVDAGAFMDWLEPRIAAFRDRMQAHEVVATAAIGLAEVTRLAPQLAAAMQRLGPHALALLGGTAGASSIHDMSARIAIIGSRAARAQLALRRSPGRRAATERNALLRQIVERLQADGVKAKPALVVAGEVLRACGVRDTPVDASTLGKAARQGKK